MQKHVLLPEILTQLYAKKLPCTDYVNIMLYLFFDDLCAEVRRYTEARALQFTVRSIMDVSPALLKLPGSNSKSEAILYIRGRYVVDIGHFMQLSLQKSIKHPYKIGLPWQRIKP